MVRFERRLKGNQEPLLFDEGDGLRFVYSLYALGRRISNSTPPLMRESKWIFVVAMVDQVIESCNTLCNAKY